MANQTSNPTLITLYQSLCAQQDTLSAAIQKATDPNVADALSTENHEVMHRIILTQNLLFQSDTFALQQAVKTVTDASTQLQAALKKIQTATDVVTGVTSYLTLVDTAIDLAKTLAPMAA
jgi:hypothetical protein